jgi:hypothetical protein
MESQPPPTPQLANDLLLSAHVAEYNALTTRCTYWIALGYGLWPLVGIILALVAQLWNTISNHELLLWGSGILVQLVMLAFNQTLREVYNAVRYLERHVRPAVQTLTGATTVWGYETYNATQRVHVVVWWEYAMPVALLITLVGLTLVRSPLTTLDVAGLVLNALFFAIIVAQSIGIVRIRYEFFPRA